MKKRNVLQQGFTLIELLVVIAIISILAVLVFVALNPAKRFQDSRNDRRSIDTGEILTAVHECIVDNAGSIYSATGPDCLSTAGGAALTTNDTYEIVTGATNSNCNVDGTGCTTATSATHCAKLDTNLEAYLKSIPTDPGGVVSGHTEYSVSIDSNNIVTIGSCSAEAGVAISASR